MDFSLESLRSAFESVDFIKRQEHFKLYCFILATESDGQVFPDILSRLPEIHDLTGESTLMIAPKIVLKSSKSSHMNAEQVAKVLATRKFWDHYGGEIHDVSDAVERFLAEQNKATYEFARLIELPLEDLPAIVFFENLKFPDYYAVWRIRELSATAVVRDLRVVISRVEAGIKENPSESVIELIHNANMERFVKRAVGSTFKTAVKAAPILRIFK